MKKLLTLVLPIAVSLSPAVSDAQSIVPDSAFFLGPDGRVELLHLWPGKLPHLNCGKTGGLWGSFDGAGNARAGLLESVAFSLELKHMGVMHQAIEDSRGHGGIAEILSPVLDNAV